MPEVLYTYQADSAIFSSSIVNISGSSTGSVVVSGSLFVSGTITGSINFPYTVISSSGQTPYYITLQDQVIIIDTLNGSFSSFIPLYLPSSSNGPRNLIIKDTGNGNTYHTRIFPAGGDFLYNNSSYIQLNSLTGLQMFCDPASKYWYLDSKYN